VEPAGVVVVVLVAALAGWRAPRLISSTERRVRTRDGRWRVRVRSRATGGYQVVVEREGEAGQVVRELPARMDAAEFSTALADARAEAEEHAAALNAAR
jgi:hypothetical protein